MNGLPPNTIDKTLIERGIRYGKFEDQAILTQAIKSALANSRNWQTLTDDKREALEMISSKIARILNGDPSYKDNWHDISGYAKLVEDTCP